MNDRDNCYSVLGLDPEVVDQTTIDRAIEECRKRWNNQAVQGSAAARRKASLNLAELPEIKRKMLDATMRREEAEKERKRRGDLKQEHGARLAEAIRLLAVRGQCSDEEVAAFVNEFAGSYTEAEIVERIRLAGIVARADERPKESKPRLDPAKMQKIRTELEFVQATDLYDFLSSPEAPVSKSSSFKALLDAADALLKEQRKHGEIEKSKRELCGHCLAIFRTPEEKNKYDSALAYEQLETEDFKRRLEQAGRDGLITLEGLDILVELAGTRRVAQADAIEFIERHAAQRKWKVQRQSAAAAFSQCGHCLAIERNQKASHCGACGKLLTIECPRCGTVLSTIKSSCTACGCSIGDAPLVQQLVRDAEGFARNCEFETAITNLERALRYWPSWSPALEAKDRVTRRCEARNRAITELEKLADHRDFTAAKAKLSDFKQEFGAVGIETLERRIGAALDEAQKLLREGELLHTSGDAEGAVLKYEAALSRCRDFASATSALGSLPPESPLEFSCATLGRGFHLVWKSSVSRNNVRFSVVRKERARPTGPMDGSVLASSLNDTEFDDLHAPEGVPIYYAVFSVRGEVASRQPAIAGPLLLAGEVRAELRSGDGEIQLSWRRPQGVKRIEVWRRTGGAPARRGEGQPLLAASDGVMDADVRNGETYGYLIIAIYEDPTNSSREIATVGVRLLAEPSKPASPVVDLQVSRRGSQAILTWSQEESSPVQIRCSSSLPTGSSGSIVSLDRLDELGSMLQVQTRGRAEWKIESQGKIVFVPVSLGRGNATIGKPVELITIDDVSTLKSRSSGRGVSLTWEWPPGAKEAFVCSRTDRYPSSALENGNERVRVTLDGYHRHDCFDLRFETPGRRFISVFVFDSASNTFSTGAQIIESMGQGTIVRYKAVVRKRGLLRRSAEVWIELECAEKLSTLPPVIVLGKDGRQPLSPTDGVVLAECSALSFADGRAKIAIASEKASPSTYVKLFFRDGGYAKEIRLQPASSELLRLG